jgi:predicted metal-dependent phosphoesterase TrpH
MNLVRKSAPHATLATRCNSLNTAMSAPTFELQSHSTYSDGELSPTAVVRAAARAGVELLALTDHDTTDGVTEAAETAATLGVRFVTGVEISVLDPGAQDLHICGYLIDPAYAALGEQLRRSRADREQRAERMASALTELGWAVDRRQLESRRAAGQTIGRPHLAEAVFAQPENAARLAAQGLENPSAFLVAYLIEGRPAFRERVAPTVGEAVDLIHAAGGVAVWAHPFWDIDADPDVLSTLARFAADGLDGVEAFYVTHTREQTDLLLKECAELNLLTTGSSDFHGPAHRQFNRFRAFQTYGQVPNLGRLA